MSTESFNEGRTPSTLSAYGTEGPVEKRRHRRYQVVKYTVGDGEHLSVSPSALEWTDEKGWFGTPVSLHVWRKPGSNEEQGGVEPDRRREEGVGRSGIGKGHGCSS